MWVISIDKSSLILRDTFPIVCITFISLNKGHGHIKFHPKYVVKKMFFNSNDVVWLLITQRL